MNLSTNSWNYGYHINLEKVNSEIGSSITDDDKKISDFNNDFKFGNFINGLSNLDELDNFVYNKINEVTSRIKICKPYKNIITNSFLIDTDIPKKISSTIDVNESIIDNDTPLLNYLLNWMYNLLGKIHKDSLCDREYLGVYYKKLYPTSTGLDVFSDELEKELILNRSKIYLEYKYYDLLYDLSVPITTNNTLSNKKLSSIYNNEMVIKNLIQEMLLGLVPVNQINKTVVFINNNTSLNNITNDISNYIVFFKNINNWKFDLGGNSNSSFIEQNLDIEIIRCKDKLSITKNDALKLKVSLDLNWVSNTYKPSHPISFKNIKFNGVYPEISTIQENEVKNLLPRSINYFLNKASDYLNSSDPISVTDLLNSISATNIHHRYYFALSYMNIAAKDAIEKPELKWMFPTTTRYAVQDDVSGTNDIKNSVLSICCMINGNPNKNAATADLNAIPDGASSALVIERSAFGEYMVMPNLLSVFDNKDLKVEHFDKKVSNSFRFPEPNSTLNTLNLEKNDYQGVYSPISLITDNGETSFKGNLNELSIRVEENLVRVSMPKVNYHINSDRGWFLTTDQDIKAYQEYESFFFLGYNSKNNPILNTKTQNVMFTLNMEYQKSYVLKNMNLWGMQASITFIKILNILNESRKSKEISKLNKIPIKLSKTSLNQINQIIDEKRKISKDVELSLDHSGYPLDNRNLAIDIQGQLFSLNRRFGSEAAQGLHANRDLNQIENIDKIEFNNKLNEYKKFLNAYHAKKSEDLFDNFKEKFDNFCKVYTDRNVNIKFHCHNRNNPNDNLKNYLTKCKETTFSKTFIENSLKNLQAVYKEFYESLSGAEKINGAKDLIDDNNYFVKNYFTP